MFAPTANPADPGQSESGGAIKGSAPVADTSDATDVAEAFVQQVKHEPHVKHEAQDGSGVDVGGSGTQSLKRKHSDAADGKDETATNGGASDGGSKQAPLPLPLPQDEDDDDLFDADEPTIPWSPPLAMHASAAFTVVKRARIEQ